MQLLDMELDLLESGQIYGENKLKVFDLIGTKAALTDYAILCGAYTSNHYINGVKSLENRIGWYWTKTKMSDEKVYAVSDDDFIGYSNVNLTGIGLRLALPFSKIKDICSDKIVGENGEIKYICGEFPQSVVSKKMEKELYKKLLEGSLKKADYIYKKNYDRDSWSRSRALNQEVYEYNGKKYALVKATTFDDKCTLSNKRKYKNGEFAFIEYQPLYWIKDEETDIVFTEKLVDSMQFDDMTYTSFRNADLYFYMNNYLIREIFNKNNSIDVICSNTNFDMDYYAHSWGQVEQGTKKLRKLCKEAKREIYHRINY